MAIGGTENEGGVAGRTGAGGATVWAGGWGIIG
jgi:hypothetical protein